MMRKLGFLQALEFHLKQVIVEFSLLFVFYEGLDFDITTHLS